ncbi:tRNA pseudouridine(38/39) synthase [Anticarsia gemmatalis]|uniref:tRNA pseudouridine(38/39) synthase n=1 Tax=Anticarsia gemmatalis TaxID=129554 RepID=UPI003F76960C
MDTAAPKAKKNKSLSREELLNLDKNELVERIIQIEAHNLQLKNIISKNLSDGDSSENSTRKKPAKPFDFSKCHFRRVLLRFLYFGWDYQGFVVQEDSTQTIEHHLFQALTKACLIESRETSNYARCGRTDKGVSAFGQVISISLRSKFPLDQQYCAESLSNEMPYCKLLNRLLPKDIRVVAWMPIPADLPEFSARFDCKKRQYKYYFPRSSLDIQAMRRGCTHVVGSHDYRNLCKMDVGNGVTQFIRELITADVIPVDKNDTDKPTSMYYLLIEGNAFLWHQIRCIMGVLLLIGQGKETPGVIAELLDVENNPRKPQYNMALDVPLNLFHCSYDLNNTWIYDKHDLSNVIAQLQSDWTVRSIQSTMINDTINVLEAQYTAMCASEKADSNVQASDKDRIIAYTDCLLQGVKPKVYTPLLKRDTCSSLEEKIEHYAKRRKIAEPEKTAE